MKSALVMTTTQRFVIFIIFLAFVLVGNGSGRAGDSIQGVVTQVVDGDSIIVNSSGRSFEVRLWGIDAPEYGQPYGYEAKRYLQNVLQASAVRLELKDVDSYGRQVALVYHGTRLINESVVTSGSGWVYRRYCNEARCERWGRLENIARRERSGLWAGNRPVAPWRWRKSMER